MVLSFSWGVLRFYPGKTIVNINDQANNFALHFDKYRWTNRPIRYNQLICSRCDVQLLFHDYFETRVQRSLVEEVFDAVTAGNYELQKS